jgi:hypothetical protein
MNFRRSVNNFVKLTEISTPTKKQLKFNWLCAAPPTTRFLTMCSFLALVPQASPKTTWPNNHFGIPVTCVSNKMPGEVSADRDGGSSVHPSGSSVGGPGASAGLAFTD